MLLWIHGGGFQMGSATAALWRDPHQLVERGVVFVGIQYRRGKELIFWTRAQFKGFLGTYTTVG